LINEAQGQIAKGICNETIIVVLGGLKCQLIKAFLLVSLFTCLLKITTVLGTHTIVFFCLKKKSPTLI